MYFDNQPCRVCGAEVRLREHRARTEKDPDGTIDDRLCTNDECPTNIRTGEDVPRP